jgi:hypothetical protein
MRSDLAQLPIEALWRRVRTEAVVTTADGLKSLQANWTALVQAIGLSPDLTEPQKNVVIEDYRNKVKEMRTQAQGQDFREGDSPANPLDALRARSLRSIA